MCNLGTKICIKCDCEKKIDRFGFAKTNKDKHKNICKDCDAQYNKLYRIKKSEIIKKQRKKYRELNQDIIKIKKKEYYEANKEKDKLRKKQKYWDNVEVEREKSRRYYSNHKEQWAKYRENRRIERRIEAINRKRGKLSLSKINKSDIENLLLSQNQRCFYCNHILIEKHIEHIIPLSKGGDHKLYNIVLSCPSCNLKKSNKMPEIFINEILKEKYEYI